MYKIIEMKLSEYNEVYSFWKSINGLGLSSADTKKNIKKYLAKNPGMSFVAKAEDYIIGTILAGHDGRRGYIYHFAVDEEFREKGIGKLLLSRVIQKFKSENILKCHLFVYKYNEIGKKIWEQLGWELREDIFVMSKEITEAGYL